MYHPTLEHDKLKDKNVVAVSTLTLQRARQNRLHHFSVRTRQALLILLVLLALFLDIRFAIHVFTSTTWSFAFPADADTWVQSIEVTAKGVGTVMAMAWLVIGFLLLGVYAVTWASEVWNGLEDKLEAGEGVSWHEDVV